MDVLFGLLAIALVLFIIWQLFALIGDMAEDRGHSPWPWWILAVMWSPFGSIIILWMFFDVVEDKNQEQEPF